jgi:hypothetical protein
MDFYPVDPFIIVVSKAIGVPSLGVPVHGNNHHCNYKPALSQLG